MFTLAVVCYTLGGLALLIAIALCLLGAKKPEGDRPRNVVEGLLCLFIELPYVLRIFCRWAYTVLLPLGGLLHYLSVS